MVSKSTNITKKEENEPFSLSNVQLAYLMGRTNKFELGGTSAHYYIEIESEMELERFNRAINMLINRHPTLRSIILSSGKQQILKTVPEYKMQIENLMGMEETEKQECLEKERERMSHHIFKTDCWPLFEFKAFKLTNIMNYICIGLDLLIADATSVNVMANELKYLYDNIDSKDKLDVKDDYNFRNFRLDCEKIKESDKYKADKQYWINKIDDFPQTPVIPLAQNLSNVKSPRFKRLSNLLDADYWGKLVLKCKEHNVRPTVVFCTAYAVLLGFWSNQSKMAINLTIANRYPFHENVKNMIGDFTSVAPINVDLQQGNTFWEMARFVQQTLTECQEHNYYEGGDFVRELSKVHSLEERAVMPIVLTSMMSKDHITQWSKLGKVKYNITQTSQVYLDNQISREKNCVRVTWDYVEQLFDEKFISKMYDQYIQLLNSAVNDLNYLLDISFQDKMLIEEYNKTEKDVKISTLHKMFMDQAKVVPNNTAVVCENQSLTYMELDRKSNQVANYLREKSIGTGDYVGVIASRHVDSIVNIMGVLKAGAAYIPIEPSQPLERRNYILNDAKSKTYLDIVSYCKNNIIEYSIEPVDEMVKDDDVAYAIYTSGSTGKPKGVVISHSAAANTIIDINTKFNVNASDRIIGLSSMCFDLSVYDIFGALSAGATLVMVPNQKDVSNIERIMNEYEITIWNSVPVIMDLLITHMMSCEDYETEGYIQSTKNKRVSVKLNYNDSLRLVLLSGDWIPLNLPVKIQDKFISAEVISLGGATEAAIWSIYYPINEVSDIWKSIPYGKPLANQTFYVLNYNQQICPIEVQGELYIGGKGVAVEYLNDVEKTKTAFIEHVTLGRLYKTGDYGVLHGDSVIEFLGRKDQQVKISGHRIELGEIEKNILRDNRIINAVVIDKTDLNNKKYLCAYIVSEDEIDHMEIIEKLEKYLPEYMIPTYFMNIDSIPLTSNGKVNKKQLPDIGKKIIKNYRVEPSNYVEKILLQIWKEVLEIENLGVCDNFFKIGGDSLNAMMIYAKMSNYFDVKFNSIYEYKTVEALSKHIKLRKVMDAST
jgi:amino acid adenylation domain-containing protein